MTATEPGAVLGGGPVNAVLFDYGMTLVTHQRPGQALERAYAEIATLLSRRHGPQVPPARELLTAVHDAVEAAVAQHDQTGSLEEIRLGRVHAEAYRRLGLRLDRRTLDAVQLIEQRAWFDGMRVPSVTLPTLGALHWRGLRVGICSNSPYHPTAMAEQIDHLGLRPMVDSVTFSGSVGWRKPSPRIFRKALSELGAHAATTLMVGDRTTEDIDGAHQAGMRAIRLRAFVDDAPDGPERADAVIDTLADLVPLVDGAGIAP